MYLEVLKLKQKEVFDKALDKAFILGGGGEPSFKDYVDLYFILKKKKITLEDIIKNCDKKYEAEFNDRLFLEELTDIKDVKEVKIEFLKEKVSKNQMEEFFKKEIQKSKDKLIK